MRVVGATVLMAAIVAGPISAGGAGARPSPRDPDAAPKRPAPANDLSNIAADRWIVQLAEAPVASYRGGTGALRPTAPDVTGAAKLDAAGSDAAAYEQHLKEGQARFESDLARVANGAKVQRRYTLAVDGLAVKMSPAQAAAVRALPGVRSVTPDVPVQLDMYATPAQIGAPTLWQQLGGQALAGDGVRVAIIDSGIYVTRDANGHYAGNPCFDDTGYKAPKGFPKGDKRFTNNKVIVARTYFRPDDPPVAGDDTAIPGPLGSSHGTHVGGTVACDAGTVAQVQGAQVTLSGVAPHAFLMNYRVFYPSNSTEDFQTGNAYVAELVQAIDDAVRDGADVMSNSWGSSYQNTLAWPDPMVQAAESAVDAGVVMVFANGNAGPDPATSIAPANSPKVIGVGAVSKNVTISPGSVDVTGPTPVPAKLTKLDVGPAQFGAQGTTALGPLPYVASETVATNGTPLGCNLSNGSNPFPAGSMSGKIAVISRGTCEFTEKVLNAQNAGASAALVYNSVANGDNIQAMGPGEVAAQVTIPSWFMRRSDGLTMVAFAAAHPNASAKFTAQPHVAPNVGDVMAGFSSRGPTTDKTIKPDVVAPGVDVVSSGYSTEPFPGTYTGFGAESGTSMATPHVAGAAALLRQLHPKWTPAQVKSALMSTATEQVFLDTAQAIPASVLDRGAGRIDLTKAGDPGLAFDQPSISGGERQAGTSFSTTVTATNVRDKKVSGDKGDDKEETWDVSVSSADSHLVVHPTVADISVKPHKSATIPVQVSTANDALGDYEADIVLVSRTDHTRLHIPVWLHALHTAPVADVLLVDDDGSGIGAGPDYRTVYKSLLDNSGVSYRYLDVDTNFFPSFDQLFGYKAVVMFTGDNASFDTSGLFPSDQDALAQWLDSGGRLWLVGQNIAEETDSNTDFSSPQLGRARLYHGYLGLRYVNGSVYSGAAPHPTVAGAGPLAGLMIDLKTSGGGTGKQTSIEEETAIGDTDTYAARGATQLFATPLGAGAAAGDGVAFGRSSEPSLQEPRVAFRYRSVGMGFGLEGVTNSNGNATRAQVFQRTLTWLLDDVSVTVTAADEGKKPTKLLTANATSTAGAAITQYRWDFGDGSPTVTTTSPSVSHEFKGPKLRTVRVEVTDALGHRSLGQLDVGGK